MEEQLRENMDSLQRDTTEYTRDGENVVEFGESSIIMNEHNNRDSNNFAINHPNAWLVKTSES